MARNHSLLASDARERAVKPHSDYCLPPRKEFATALIRFVEGDSAAEDGPMPPPDPVEKAIAVGQRLDAIAEVLRDWDPSRENIQIQRAFKPPPALGPEERKKSAAEEFEALALGIAQDGNLDRIVRRGGNQPIETFVTFIIDRWLVEDCDAATAGPNAARLAKLLDTLAETAMPDDQALIDRARQLEARRLKDQDDLAGINVQLGTAKDELTSLKIQRTSFASDRNAKRQYPISPDEVSDFFLPQNLRVLAIDIARTRATQRVHATDVRNYLRHQLSVAFDLMTRPVTRPSQPGQPAPWINLPAPFARIDMLDSIRLDVQQRFYHQDLPQLYNGPFLQALPANLANKPLGALCWAVAVDAVLLDEALREQVRVVAAANGLPCPNLQAIRFYWPTPEAAAAFHDYVAHRWPIITFAVDPVTDQQNILDSFSLRRDLQLALAFAFSTGQIGFNQLNTFRRKIEQDSETIALNKTVTAFTHGNETFGWRFYPRFQNPPSQSNFATLTSTLIYGGPKPNYGLRKSKIEPGQRELTAVIVMPSFLPTVRVEASGNWFRLDDPEHLVVSTRRMLEEGRKVQEVRQALNLVGNAHAYRAADVRHLAVQVDQVEAMLPIQSQLVMMPFDSAANGFDLFTPGATALVPELSGFEGAEQVIGGLKTDLLLLGRFFSIHETRVVAGGRAIKEDTTNTGDGEGFEILSREVMRVTLPADVEPTATLDGQAMVELYVATPNGISNRLLIPFVAPEAVPGPVRTGGGAARDPAGTRRTTTTGTVTIDLTKKEFPTAAAGATPPAASGGTPPAGGAATPHTFPTGVPGTATPEGFDPAQAGARVGPRAGARSPALAGRTGRSPGRDRDPALSRTTAAEPEQDPSPPDLTPPLLPVQPTTPVLPVPSPPITTALPAIPPSTLPQVPAPVARALQDAAAARVAPAMVPATTPPGNGPLVITPPAPIMIMTQDSTKGPEARHHSLFSGLRRRRRPAVGQRP